MRRRRRRQRRGGAPWSTSVPSMRQPAAGRADREVQQAQQAGLAGAGGAEQPAEAAVGQGEAEVVQHLGAVAAAGMAVAQPHAIESDHVALSPQGASSGSEFGRVNLGSRGELWQLVRMRIVCPSCDAAYEVANSLVVPGRIVRCSRCGGEWVALTVEAPVADNEPEAEPELFPDALAEHELTTPRLTAMDRLIQTGRRRRGGGAALRLAWGASIVLLLALGWAAYVWRADVMQSWPASIRLYSGFGPTTPAAR